MFSSWGEKGVVMSQSISQDRLIDLHLVKKIVGLSKAMVYLLIAREEFPAQIKIGKRSLWSENQIRAWVDDRVANPIPIGRKPNYVPSPNPRGLS